MKKLNKLTIFLIPIGIAVNVVGGQLALMLKLPVFLDSIGTFVVAALCGIGPGIIVAIGTQLINAITTPTVLAYIEIGMLFAVWSYLFAKHGIYESVVKCACSIAPGIQCLRFLRCGNYVCSDNRMEFSNLCVREKRSFAHYLLCHPVITPDH